MKKIVRFYPQFHRFVLVFSCLYLLFSAIGAGAIGLELTTITQTVIPAILAAFFTVIGN